MVYIIIATHNGGEWIENCLESTSPFQVVLIDNNSSDETLRLIIKYGKRIKVLKQKINIGFGKANNLGIRYALDEGADAVFLLNQDAYLEQGTLQELLKLQKEKPQYGILSPIHLNGKGDKLDLSFSKYLAHEYDNGFYSDYILNHTLKPVYSIPFVNAAGWLISKQCLMTVGGFDPIFFHYGEDDNYCQRVLFHGFKIGIVPETFLKHDREHREVKKKNTSSIAHYNSLEKNIKVKHANINSLLSNELNDVIKRRKIAMLKSFMKLNFKAANNYKKEYSLYKKIILEVMQSRQINKTKGSHYI